MNNTAKQTDGTKEPVERSDMERKKRNEIFLIGGILIFIFCFWLITHFFIRRPGELVVISVDGAIIKEFPLNQDIDFVIESSNGGTNRLIIEDGQAFISEASCPDKRCMLKGAIHEKGEEPIVCLPNRVVVTIK